MAADRDEENAAIAAAWIGFMARLHPDEGELTKQQYAALDDGSDWAADRVIELAMEDPERAYDIALSVARQSADDWVLANLGAGPLETLIRHSPREYLDRLQADVASCPTLKLALASVWHDLPEDLERQLHAILGRVD